MVLFIYLFIRTATVLPYITILFYSSLLKLITVVRHKQEITIFSSSSILKISKSEKLQLYLWLFYEVSIIQG